MLDDRKLGCCAQSSRITCPPSEPVGSKALVERHSLDVSPATDPQRHGRPGGARVYIIQPHTSAGRVPTDKGYRLFVDRLSGLKPLSAAERRAIETFLAGAYDLDDVVTRTVRLLAQLTRQVAVVQYPSLDQVGDPPRRACPARWPTAASRADHWHRPGGAALGRPSRRHVRRGDRASACGARMRRSTGEGSRMCHASSPVCRRRWRPAARPNAEAVFSVVLETLVDHQDGKVVFGGAANLAASRDFSDWSCARSLRRSRSRWRSSACSVRRRDPLRSRCGSARRIRSRDCEARRW